jgi:hypothetical protein
MIRTLWHLIVAGPPPDPEPVDRSPLDPGRRTERPCADVPDDRRPRHRRAYAVALSRERRREAHRVRPAAGG